MSTTNSVGSKGSNLVMKGAIAADEVRRAGGGRTSAVLDAPWSSALSSSEACCCSGDVLRCAPDSGDGGDEGWEAEPEDLVRSFCFFAAELAIAVKLMLAPPSKLLVGLVGSPCAFSGL